MIARRALGAAILAAHAGGCSDPLTDQRIAALGGEKPGVAPSEYHRAGQPCVLCHGDGGGVEPLITVGGTIFAKPDGRLPVSGAVVTLKDAAGHILQKTTNCVGNFYAVRSEWDPTFPVHVLVDYEDPSSTTVPKARRTSAMASHIAREPSCAGCHLDPGDSTDSRSQLSPGRVFCSEDPNLFFPLLDPSCPGKP
jgi:hypothetical protein